MQENEERLGEMGVKGRQGKLETISEPHIAPKPRNEELVSGLDPSSLDSMAKSLKKITAELLLNPQAVHEKSQIYFQNERPS